MVVFSAHIFKTVHGCELIYL